MATNGNTLSNGAPTMAQGVGLKDVVGMLAQMNEAFAQQRTEIEAMKAQAAQRPTLTSTGPAIAKVAAQPVNAQVWKPGQPLKLAGTPAAKTVSSSGKPCGSKSPNGLCQKCDGPFHPVLHYSLEAILRLDGIDAPITHENWKTAKFLGISVDPNYWGNVVIVGFGKDCINMRPKNAIALANGLMGGKAAAHVSSVLKSNNAAHLLVAE